MRLGAELGKLGILFSWGEAEPVILDELATDDNLTLLSIDDDSMTLTED